MRRLSLLLFFTLIISGILLSGCKKVTAPTADSQTQDNISQNQNSSPPNTQSFDNIKTPHFVSSTPANNAVLSSGPSEVIINFNFNLASSSKISVKADGNDVGVGNVKIATDKLSMKMLVNPIEPADYMVEYTACWPDGSCHEGSFGFFVKSP